MQPMSSGAAAVTGVATTQVLRCPLCGKPVTPDALGFSECPCGWGGLEDPVESAHGLSRRITLIDRRWAAALARHRNDDDLASRR